MPITAAKADASRAVLGENVVVSRAATTGPAMKTTSSAVASRLSARVRCDPDSVSAVQIVRIDAPSGGASRPVAPLSRTKARSEVPRACTARAKPQNADACPMPSGVKARR